MRTRRDSLAKATRLHADFYHRQQIESLRAEGERLRRELRLRGVNPSEILRKRTIFNNRENHV